MKKNQRTNLILLSIFFALLVLSASLSKLEHLASEITLSLFLGGGVVLIVGLWYIIRVSSGKK